MKGTDSVTVLKGVGAKTAKLFAKLGIYTVSDMLHYFPKDYDCYTAPVPITRGIAENTVCAIYGQVVKKVSLIKKGSLTVAIASVKDIYGNPFQAIWYNQAYISSVIRSGESYVFRGKIQWRARTLSVEQPEYFSYEKYQEITGRMLPIYPLTAGISRNLFMKCIHQILDNLPQIEYNEKEVPERIMLENGLIDEKQAVLRIHFPEKYEDYQTARASLVFSEFFWFALAVAHMKQSYGDIPNAYILHRRSEADRLAAELPFALTQAQRRVWEEMRNDMTGNHTMHRLIQGDVGSGKTILAFLTLYEVALCGYQGFMMAPTEVLAVQHFQALRQLLEEHEIQIEIELLTGSLKPSEKQRIRQRIHDGTVSIVIGTHALLEESVSAKNLALVITDEQHRFGVCQREVLTTKGEHPHVCVMSATPIPRTLGMILYGDLDISVLDEKPSHRLPIKNCIIGSQDREKAYRFLQRQIAEGHQGYVICPMVEASELMQGENVFDYAEHLKQYFSKETVIGILHGRMKAGEKQQVMDQFANGKIHILVATVVVEVGVDVANATVIMIEDAQRFGLAQLHQLRGRVGRGKNQSYCIFVQTEGALGENDRLEVVNHSNDGFYIASQDLQLRGPGDLLGVRQSGDLNFSLGDIYQDSELLSKAVDSAKNYWDQLTSEERECFSICFADEKVIM